jgi:KTSC domain
MRKLFYRLVPAIPATTWHRFGQHTSDMPSSVIRSYQYHPGEQRLRIIYISGAVYDYLGVPAEVYAAMKAYQSKGTFLNREIKGRYPFQKVL